MADTVQGRKRYLWSSLLFVIVAACLVAVVYVSQAYKGSSEINGIVTSQDAVQSDKLIGVECPQPCITKECISFTNMLMTNMKTEDDPCENFYSYACGNNGKVLGKDEDTDIGEENKKIMISVLKDILDKIDANPGTASWKMKIVYDSCIKVASDTQALPYAIQFLSDTGIGPDWPNLSDDFKFQDLTTTLGKLVYFQFPFITIMLMPTAESEILNAVFGIPPLLLLDQRIDYEREKILEYILRGFDINRETIDQIKNDYSTIRQLVENMTKENYMEGDGEQFIHLDCLNKLEEESVYICNILDTFMDELNMRSKIDKSNVNVYPVVLQLISELKLYPDRYLANYVAINFFWSHMEDLGFSFQLKHWKLTEQIKPIPHVVRPKTREDYCVGWIAQYIMITLGYEFVQEVFPNEAFNEINRIVEESGEEVVDFIHKQKWFPDNSRNKFNQQFENYKSSINVLPNVLFDEAYINDLYKEFHPDKENFLKNVLQGRAHIWKVMEQLSEKEDMYNIFEVQANPSPTPGELILGLGMLFGPIYSFGRPRLLNLITLSSVVPHEIGHSLLFFIEDILSEGALLRNDYANRTSCMEEQFSQFEYLGGGKLDGSKYFFETYADAVSVQVLDKLIEKYASTGFSMLGFNYSTEQLLYISAAQMYCSKSSVQYDDWLRRFDEHSPGRYRVIAKMQSSEGFSRAFNCPEGSYMNPAVKCLAFDTI